jgi:hypothetical protein
MRPGIPSYEWYSFGGQVMAASRVMGVSASAMGEFEKPAFLRFIMGSVLSGAECPNELVGRVSNNPHHNEKGCRWHHREERIRGALLRLYVSRFSNAAVINSP